MNFPARLKAARQRAAEYHSGQSYGYMPYTYHLDQVLSVALEFEITNESLLVATRYHDALEDCEDITVETIAEAEGVDVAWLVWCVTNESGKTKKIRGARTYPKTASTNLSTALKLCDRIANIRNCKANLKQVGSNGRIKSKYGKYLQEYPAFRKALRREPNGSQLSQSIENMWNVLDMVFHWEKAQGKTAFSSVSFNKFNGQIPEIFEHKVRIVKMLQNATE